MCAHLLAMSPLQSSARTKIPELVSIAFHMNEKEKVWKGRLPMMLKGIGFSFNKFDEYQFGKYGRARDVEVSMRDALFLTHPRAKDEAQQALFNSIAKDEIKIPETWEQVIMQKGSTAEQWEGIIPKMGYMALLRNLRNFVEKKVNADSIQYVVDD